MKADDTCIHVVRANGGVEAGSRSKWFRSSSDRTAWGTIVVPIDAGRMRPLPLWTAVTTIVFNLAVAVAFAAVGNF